MSKIIGYWAEGRWDKEKGRWIKKEDTKYPMPKSNKNPWEGQKEFLTNLEKICHVIEPIHYKGISICRLCGSINGSTEYMLDDYIWPSGLFHYIRDHNVKPPQEFIGYVNETVKNVKE